MIERMRFRNYFPILVMVSGLLSATTSWAQVKRENDDTVLKQIILFSRHGVRSAMVPNSTVAPFAVKPFPDFGVPTGNLTPHGAVAETLLGEYFRAYLTKERLLTGDSQEDAAHSYFRSNSIERSYASAVAFSNALLPASQPSIHSFAIGQPDPVFDPLAAQIVTLDAARATQEAEERFKSGAAIASALSGEFALVRSALFDYPLGEQPPPPTPPGLIDATAIPITLIANTTELAAGNAIGTTGLLDVTLATDPFVMEYADGLTMSDVAWGHLTRDQVSQQTGITNAFFDVEVKTPYLAGLQSSNVAAHILRTMQQAVSGRDIPGSFGDANSRIIVLDSSDTYVDGLAGLLHLKWHLSGYQPNYCPPGGSIVFELRTSRSSGKDVVRAYFTSQSLDELRNLTPFTLDQPPLTQQLIFGERDSKANLDISFDEFEKLMQKAINPQDVANPSNEIDPGPLTGVPIN